MIKKLILNSFMFSILVACNSNVNKIKNIKKGALEPSIQLVNTSTKKILLDNDTAPKPQYVQIYSDSLKNRYLTFLNTYNNSIYFYNYNSSSFVKKISFEKKGPNGIQKPMGYYIKNTDSIYIYNSLLIELVLANSKSDVLKKISLKGGEDIHKSPWGLIYPQYSSETATPFIETSKELIFTGQFMQSIPKDIITDFKFTSHLNLKTNSVYFTHRYPNELYGSNYNWKGQLYTSVFPELHPDGNKLIYSFPISHDLFITELDSENYTKVYGGSNFAETITSIDKTPNKTSREQLLKHIINQDEYGAIKYDKFRKVYYRVLLKGIDVTNTDWKEKPIVIIVMDNDFNYLGETTLGSWREWNWKNIFVTQEGLNIEYLDDEDIDEVSMTLKIFTLKKL